VRSLDDLTMYVYGLLEESSNEAMKEHLKGCTPCARMADRMRSEHRLFETALARQIPETAVRMKAVDDILARRRPNAVPAKAAPKRALAFLRPATALAVSFSAILLVLHAAIRPPAAEPPPAPAVATAPEARHETAAYLQDSALGSIVGKDEQGRSVGELGLKSHRVTVEILDGVAKTTVEENFQNHTDRRLEGTFRFPLPPDASISRLALEVNGKMEEGTCLERQRAREVFESIVRSMKDPALLEWMPGGLFQCRVFPIEPRSTKRVIIAYTQALPFFRGRSTYTYPLAAEKTRVHPPEELRIDVRIRCSGELRSVTCPSHPADIQRRDPGEAVVAYGAAHTRPKNDFVISFETGDDELRLIPHKPEGEDGYFALFVTPRGAPERRPAKYVFLLDVSASVSEPELEVARRLVRAMIGNAVPGDRFEILAANIDVSSSGEVDGLRAAPFLDGLRPVGGLDLHSALRSAPAGEIIYVGKGLATWGETEPAKILDAARGRSIRSVGIGSRANVALMQKLGGHFRINPSDDVAGRVAEVAATLGSPILSGIALSGGDAIYDVSGVRDVHFGERLLITGRYRAASAKLVLSGRDYRRERDASFPIREDGNNYVRRLWAQRRIADLLVQGESRRAEITALGIRHQIMTPYTSFLVLENEGMWRDYSLHRVVGTQDQVLGAGGDPRSRPAPAQPTPEPPSMTRFSLVSNGAAQEIDLPRLSRGSDGRTYAEVRTTTNQFGGLEFSLGESRSAAFQPLKVLHSDAPPIRLQHYKPVEFSTAYTAKVDPGKTLEGRPFTNPSDVQRLLQRFSLVQELEREMSRDATGKLLGKLNFDPQSNCFVARDSKAVLDRIGRILQFIDVEPSQVIVDNSSVAIVKSFNDRLRRTRQRVTMTFVNAPLPQIVEEFRQQTGWTIFLSPAALPSEDRIDKFLVDDESALAAMRALAYKAGLEFREEKDGSISLSRPKRISLDVQGEDIRTVIAKISRESGADILIGAEVKGTVTMRASCAPWTELLADVARSLNYTTLRGEGTPVRVLHPDTLLKEMDVRMYPLKYLSPEEAYSDLTNVLEALLTRDREGNLIGGLAFNAGASTFVILDNEVVRERAREVAACLDVQPGVATPFTLRLSYPPGVPRLLEEARRRLSAPLSEPGREAEIQAALRRLTAALLKAYGRGRMAAEVADPVDGSGVITLSAGSDAGVESGDLFAVTRGADFCALVRVVEPGKERSKAAVWDQMSVSRILQGDRAERIRDLATYFETLPEEARNNVRSRARLAEIRAKMGLKE
jgi:Ca-activated chloride channel homolog